MKSEAVMLSSNNSTSSFGSAEPSLVKNTNYERTIQILIITVGFIGVVNNGLVFVVVHRVRALRTLSNFFVVSQAAIDLISSVVIVLVHLIPVDDVPRGTAGEFLCRVWVSRVLMWGSLYASTYNLLVLTLDRYFAILHPLRYVAFFDKTKAAITVTITWAVTYCYSFYATALVVLGDGYCERASLGLTRQRVLGVATFSINYLLPVFVMSFAYIRIGMGLKDTGVAPAPQVGSGGLDTSMFRARLNIYKTLCVVFSAFVVCWTPIQVLFLLYNLNASRFYDARLTNFSVVLVYCNCTVNPIIYGLKHRQFRAGLKLTFCGKNGVSPDGTTTNQQP